MSSIWPRRYVVLLTPGTFRLRECERGLRRRQALDVRFEQAEGITATILKLAVALRECGPNADVSVLLGGGLLKFDLQPAVSGVNKPADILRIALARLRERMGLDAARWSVRVDTPMPSGKRLVAALAKETANALSAACTEAGCRLVSIRPLLSVVVAAMKPGGAVETVLALVEPDGLTCVRASDIEIAAVQSMEIDSADPDHVQAAVERFVVASQEEGGAPRLVVGQAEGVDLDHVAQSWGAQCWRQAAELRRIERQSFLDLVR